MEGNFTGNFLDSTECASGKIILMERTKLEKKIKKIKNKVDKKYNKIYKDTSLVRKTQILKDGDDFTINWEGNKLRLFIWDANMEDRDKIELKKP